MATETTTKLTGAEAIEAFAAAHRDGEGVRVWSYSPNGGYGGPTASNDWGSEDWVRELLDWWREKDALHDAGEIEDAPEAEYDPADRSLELSYTPDRGVHQYYTMSYRETPDKGRDLVAYDGANSGFCWQGDFFGPGGPEALKKLLEHLRWDDAELAEFGLASCEDYDCGDDGGYWLVADAEEFAAVLARCREFSETYDDADDGSEEYEGDDVAEFVRTGAAPEWMRDGDGPGADR